MEEDGQTKKGSPHPATRLGREARFGRPVCCFLCVRPDKGARGENAAVDDADDEFAASGINLGADSR